MNIPQMAVTVMLVGAIHTMQGMTKGEYEAQIPKMLKRLYFYTNYENEQEVLDLLTGYHRAGYTDWLMMSYKGEDDDDAECFLELVIRPSSVSVLDHLVTVGAITQEILNSAQCQQIFLNRCRHSIQSDFLKRMIHHGFMRITPVSDDAKSTFEAVVDSLREDIVDSIKTCEKSGHMLNFLTGETPRIAFLLTRAQMISVTAGLLIAGAVLKACVDTLRAARTSTKTDDSSDQQNEKV